MTICTRILQTAGIAALITGPAWCFQPSPDPPPIPPLLMQRSNGSYLGLGVVELIPERVKALNLRDEHGVEVTRVEEESPADKAGLKMGDVVLEFNGQRVEGMEQFMRMVRETPPGREVKLSVNRSGALQQVSLKTGSRKTWLTSRYGETAVEIPRIEIPDIRIPDVPRAFMSWRSTVLGIEAESLDSQLAQFFGVKEGVLVRSVVKASPAEKAGLRAGDVIVKVDGTNVATPREVTTAVRAAHSRKTVSIAAVRDKRELTFPVPVEDSANENNHAIPKRPPLPRN
ncbi:MAG: PDZ domain-containing protein [Bryobacteraceae bacterium]|nr:PDZ domain-containing protein [Bryobacteraceae bacterium]